MAEAAGYLFYLDTRPLSKAVDAIGEALAKNPVRTNQIMAEANLRLAQDMKSSVLHSYDQVVTARKTVPSYREGQDRFSGGRLRDALRNDVNYVVTARGIKFVDLDYMDSAAAHWYRLNFGAGGAAGRPPYSYSWELDGQSLGRLELAWAPSAPFRMPAGVFTESGAFYPNKLLRTIGTEGMNVTAKVGRGTLTRGIGARRFLDAGIDRFSREFPRVYGDVLIQIRDEKLANLRNIKP